MTAILGGGSYGRADTITSWWWQRARRRSPEKQRGRPETPERSLSCATVRLRCFVSMREPERPRASNDSGRGAGAQPVPLPPSASPAVVDLDDPTEGLRRGRKLSIHSARAGSEDSLSNTCRDDPNTLAWLLRPPSPGLHSTAPSSRAESGCVREDRVTRKALRVPDPGPCHESSLA